MSDKQIVAIVHHVCPICAKQDDGSLLIHKNLRDISRIHNQNVGWKLCDECQDAITNKKAIMLIVVDEKRSSGDLSDPVNWYRCGCVFGVTEDYIKRVFQPEELVHAILKKRSSVITVYAAEQLGFDVSTYREHEKSLQNEQP